MAAEAERIQRSATATVGKVAELLKDMASSVDLWTDDLEGRFESFEKGAQREQSKDLAAAKIVALNLGGTMVEVSSQALALTHEAYPNKFTAMLQARWRSLLPRDRSGCIFLDFNVEWVQPIINAIRSLSSSGSDGRFLEQLKKHVPSSEAAAMGFYEVCKFFEIDIHPPPSPAVHLETWGKSLATPSELGGLLALLARSGDFLGLAPPYALHSKGFIPQGSTAGARPLVFADREQLVVVPLSESSCWCFLLTADLHYPAAAVTPFAMIRQGVAKASPTCTFAAKWGFRASGGALDLFLSKGLEVDLYDLPAPSRIKGATEMQIVPSRAAEVFHVYRREVDAEVVPSSVRRMKRSRSPPKTGEGAEGAKGALRSPSARKRRPVATDLAFGCDLPASLARFDVAGLLTECNGHLLAARQLAIEQAERAASFEAEVELVVEEIAFLERLAHQLLSVGEAAEPMALSANPRRRLRRWFARAKLLQKKVAKATRAEAAFSAAHARLLYFNVGGHKMSIRRSLVLQLLPHSLLAQRVLGSGREQSHDQNASDERSCIFYDLPPEPFAALLDGLRLQPLTEVLKVYTTATKAEIAREVLSSLSVDGDLIQFL